MERDSDRMAQVILVGNIGEKFKNTKRQTQVTQLPTVSGEREELDYI